MINVRLSQIHNNKPYYEIQKGPDISHAFGTSQAISIIKSLNGEKEQIKIESIEGILEEHNKLLEFVKNDK